jgi:hypothetical protein
VDVSALQNFVTWFTDQVLLLRTLELAALLLLLGGILKARRENRALRAQLLRLKVRVDALEAEGYRTLMRSLTKERRDLHTDGPALAPAESSRIEPKPSPWDRGGAKTRHGGTKR